MDDTVYIQVRFSIKDDNGVAYNDALYMTLDDYQALSKEQLEAMKQERFQAWKESIAAASQVQVNIDPIESAANLNIEIENLEQQREDQIKQVAADKQITIEEVSAQVNQKVEELKNPTQTETEQNGVE